MTDSKQMYKRKAETRLRAKNRQMSWAKDHRIEMERPDYTLKAEANLFAPLSGECLKDLSGAQGGELNRRSSGSVPP